MPYQKLINAWKEASEDLNIEIITPFLLTSEDGKEHRFELLVKDFGRSNGTIVFIMNEKIEDSELDFLRSMEYFCSRLNPEFYSTYNRKQYIDTLNDWGYFGAAEKTPKWYTSEWS